MKKFTLLLCMCLAAWCVPQRVWADGITGTTDIKITTSSPGQVSSLLTAYYNAQGYSTDEQKGNWRNSVTKITLDGYFSSSDLEAIKAITSGEGSPGFNSVKEVDMSEAHIVTSSSAGVPGDYYLFHNEASGTYSTGDKAIENIDKLYIWASSIGWQPTGTPANENEVTRFNDYAAMVAAKETSTLNSYAAYPKDPAVDHYLSLTITDESWGSMSTVDPGDATPVAWNENDKNSHLAEYGNGKTIQTKRYYKKIALPEGSKDWYLCYPTAGDLSGAQDFYWNTDYGENAILLYNGNSYPSSGEGSPLSADITNLDPNRGGDGSYLWFYVYYTKSNGSWGEMSTRATEPASNTYTAVTFLEDKLSDKLNDYINGTTIRLKRYYRKQDAGYAWRLLTTGPTAEDLSAEGVHVWNGTQLGADMTNLFRSYASVGDYLSFDVYYTKTETRSWTDVSEQESQAATFPYEYRNNHLMDYNRDDVVKISEYSYYQLTSGSGDASWQEIAFNDGDKYFISFRATSPATLPSPNDAPPTYPNSGDYGVVLKSTGGAEKVYDGTTWVAAGSPVDNYREMKFSYWSSSLEKATTSKYADTSISDEIFRNCEKITEVNYLSGNVTGFDNHQGPTYAEFEVNIGKDVTSIDAAAFRRANITKIEFIDNYTADEKTAAAYYFASPSGDRPDYPKELTIGDEAFMNCVNLEGITIPNRVISIGTDAFHLAGNNTEVFTVDFERRSSTFDDSDVAISFDHDLVIGNGCFNQCEKLAALSLPIRLVSLGNMAFADTPNLTNVDIREDVEEARIKTITSNAFLRSGLTSIKIPRSVTEIQAGAFQECFYIKTITFQKQIGENGELPPAEQEPLIIRSGAFAGGTETKYELDTVKVKMHPSERLLVCEYNAFNFTSLVGQTNETSKQMAVLDFADEDWDYYQGNWKKGYAFSQSNLNLFKDGTNRATSQPTVKSKGLVSVLDNEPRNGWQQFAMSSTNREIVIPKGDFIRTFSVTEAYTIPIKYGTEEPIVKIYRVTAFDDGYNVSKDIYSADDARDASRTATATEIQINIPANTGLIMKGNKEENENFVAFLGDPVNNVKEYPYDQDVDNSEDVNLLEPTSIPSGNPVIVNPTEPYPIWKNNTNTAENYRIFGLANAAYGDILQYSFGRMKPNQTMPFNRAYLKLPVDLFHWANESVGTAPTYNDAGSGSRIALLFDDEDNSEITGIKTKSFKTTSNGSYYTMQGVKVARPQGKGIFIHNGKKIIVK